MKRLGSRIPRLKFVVILGCLLLILALTPAIQGAAGPGTFRMLGLIGLLVPVLAVAAVDESGRPRRVALSLATLCFLASADSIGGFSHLPAPVDIALCVLFLAYTTAHLLAGVVRSRSVTPDVIAGALAAYMMIGLTWAFAYGLVETVRPDAIRGLAEGGAPPDFPALLYFSYITLLTIGYGDITPASAAARMLAVGEGLVGMAFTTVILAVLVAGHLRDRGNRV